MYWHMMLAELETELEQITPASQPEMDWHMILAQLETSHTNMHQITPTWRPPARFLHYQALYHGIYDYLRAPPSHAFHSPALLYLQELQASYHPLNVLQLHRILWVEAWLSALGEPDSDAETIVQDDDSS
jgi:hypothetical protein